MMLILLLICVWAVIVIAGAEWLGDLPWPVRALYFAVAGIVWILPLKPLLRWMELGRFRDRPDSQPSSDADRGEWRE